MAPWKMLILVEQNIEIHELRVGKNQIYESAPRMFFRREGGDG